MSQSTQCRETMASRSIRRRAPSPSLPWHPESGGTGSRPSWSTSTRPLPRTWRGEPVKCPGDSVQPPRSSVCYLHCPHPLPCVNTVLRAVVHCGPLLPGKAIKLCFSTFTQNSLSLKIQLGASAQRLGFGNICSWIFIPLVPQFIHFQMFLDTIASALYFQ